MARYRIHQIKLDLYEDLSNIPKKIKKKLKRSKINIIDWKIVKESVDARKKSRILKVYSVDFICDEMLDCELAPNKKYIAPKVEETVDLNNLNRPVIVGFGPCGIFAALIMAEAGLRPIVLERGAPIESRVKDVNKYWKDGVLNPESNVQFGEGGAGTFSDGKLTTGINDIRISKVLDELAAAGGGEDILYKQRPHIGTDLLKGVILNLRKKIIGMGATVLFYNRLASLELQNGAVSGIFVEETCPDSGNVLEQRKIKTNAVILALGHSSRDTFTMLRDAGMVMEQKPFSMGVRIRHPQKIIDQAQYGNAKLAEILGPAEYKLSHRCKNGRGVYTFCMCPGGHIIPAATEPEMIVVNGMSNHKRSGEFANSGLLVDIRVDDFPSKDPLAGVELQRKHERLAYELGGGRPPETVYSDFQDSAVARALPDFVSESILESMPHLGRKLNGFDDPGSVMVGIETRSSCPLRILRDKDFSCNISGVYPAGEGAGYAGGIISAAVDGIKVSEAIITKLDIKDT